MTDTVIHLGNGQSLRVRELSGGRADVETRNENGETISSVTMGRLALMTLVRTAGLIAFSMPLDTRPAPTIRATAARTSA